MSSPRSGGFAHVSGVAYVCVVRFGVCVRVADECGFVCARACVRDDDSAVRHISRERDALDVCGDVTILVHYVSYFLYRFVP